MINKSFFGYSAIRLNYTKLDKTQPDPVRISLPEKVALLSGCTPAQVELIGKKKTLLKKGAEVKTGETLRLFEGDDLFMISSVTGKVTDVGVYTGPFGNKLARVEIECQETDVMDESLYSPEKLEGKNAYRFVSQLPGRLRLLPLSGEMPPVKEVVVCGEEKDLSVISNQYTVKHDRRHLESGIGLLKEMYGAEKVTLAVPKSLEADVQGLGDGVCTLSDLYPSGAPRLIAREILGRSVPAGKSILSEGLAFVTAETAASLGRIRERADGIFDKNLNLVLKNGESIFLKARLGTPISHILNHFGEELQEGDYLIAGGGPLTGVSLYDPNYTVSPFMDAVLVESSAGVLESSDYACINCGKCIRVCPANIPVNMLIRHLTVGKYVEAQEKFNLDSCLECGLCSYICVSKMPIMQRIKLGKLKIKTMKEEATAGGSER